jgi:ketosteroid isomerase-like protein
MHDAPSTRVVVRRVFAALRAHDLDRFRSLLCPDATLENAVTGVAHRGPDRIAGQLRPLLAAMPDLTPEIVNLMVDGEQAAVEVVRTGTHTEELVLPERTVPPTGETVELAECLILRVEGERVRSITAYTDRRALEEQLGLG